MYEPSRLSSQGHLSLLKTATSTFVQSDVAMENSLRNNGHGNGHCQTVPTAYTSLGSYVLNSSAQPQAAIHAMCLQQESIDGLCLHKPWPSKDETKDPKFLA